MNYYSGDNRLPFAWAGWNDAYHNLPMNYLVLDRASPACARAYETARLRVMALRYAGRKVPKWGRITSVPNAIGTAYELTDNMNDMAQMEGAAFWPTGPRNWMKAA